jgi:ABC-type glutathione transport system ATPase component
MNISNLSLSFKVFDKLHKVLDNVSFSIGEGESIAIVGESGSGKSTLGKCLLGLNSSNNSVIESGQIIYNGHNLLSLKESELNQYRGKEIAMIKSNNDSRQSSIRKFIKTPSENQ